MHNKEIENKLLCSFTIDTYIHDLKLSSKVKQEMELLIYLAIKIKFVRLAFILIKEINMTRLLMLFLSGANNGELNS